MKNLSKIGQIIFTVPMVVFGIMHFMNAGDMAGMVPSFIPGGVFWVYITGLALIAASVSIWINKLTFLASLLLGIMLMVFVLTIHLPGVMNEETMQMSMAMMLKDLGLAGGAFLIAGINKE